MAARIKYEVDGVKVPSLITILDNCKIGGIGNLLYRANQQGLAGRHYPNPGEDTTNAGLCAYKQIKAIADGGNFVIDEYSDGCIDRAIEAVNHFLAWVDLIDLQIVVKNITLVSEQLKFGDTFNICTFNDGKKCLVLTTFHNEVYIEDLIKVAADCGLCAEHSIAIDKAFIVQVNNPKTIDDIVACNINEYDVKDISFAFEVFKSMRSLHDMQLTLKTLI